MDDPDFTSVVSSIRSSLTEYQQRQDTRLLTEAVARVHSVTEAGWFVDIGRAAQAVVWALGAAASTMRARTADAEPADLDRAIQWGQCASDTWPPGDLGSASVRVNIATALTDRYDRDGDMADLRQALPLFDAAIPDLRANGARVDIALHSHGVTLYTLATADDGTDPGLLDRAIELVTSALECPEPDEEERAGYLNSLGLALRAKGLAEADPDLLRASDETYRRARQRGERGGDNHTAATLNLASVLQDRAEAETRVELLREAVDLYRGLLLVVADEPRRLRVTANLATALVNLYRYSRDRAMLFGAIADLRHAADAMPSTESRQIVLANLAAALHEMYDHIGGLALLDAAIAVHEELLSPPYPRKTERVLNLGVSLLARFRRRRADEDLERAIALFDETASRTTSQVERASALNSHANALSLRFDVLRERQDIDEGIRLRERAVRVAAPASLDVATYRGNLGVDLLKRYELTGDRHDLERAVVQQRTAVREVPDASVDQPRLLAGLADSLAASALDRKDMADGDEYVTAARKAYRKAVAAGRLTLPEQALGAAIRWGGWESRRTCWADAIAAYDLGLDTLTRLVRGQRSRADKESWLGDAQGLPAAAAFAHARQGDLAGAVAAAEHGRAMLLAEALRDRPAAAAPEFQSTTKDRGVR